MLLAITSDYVMRNAWILLIAMAALLLAVPQIEAKNYKFNIDDTAETQLIRKHKDPSFKVIRVVSTDKNFDKAMDRAAMCAVADAMFRGIGGSIDPISQENVPDMKPLIPSGIKGYTDNKVFFDNFFKKGDFNQFIRRAMTDFPTGENNVKTKQGTRVIDIYILNVKALSQYLEQNGIEVKGDKLKF